MTEATASLAALEPRLHKLREAQRFARRRAESLLPGLRARDVHSMADARALIELLQERLSAAHRPRAVSPTNAERDGEKQQIRALKTRLASAEKSEQAALARLKQTQASLAAKDAALRMFGEKQNEQASAMLAAAYAEEAEQMREACSRHAREGWDSLTDPQTAPPPLIFFSRFSPVRTPPLSDGRRK